MPRSNDEGPEGYLVPHDANPTKPELSLAMRNVSAALSKLECHHLLVILDRSSLSLDFVEPEKDWVLAMDNLPSGLYWVTVKIETNREEAPSPGHNLFEVVRP